ncbi:MAG: hypothetical protein JWO22_1929 [Frankiales bacterium]|nr:hypothetical protein [Frankiales bacterium]
MTRAARSTPLLVLVSLVAIALRAYPFFQPHTFLGVMEVDDGVYYGASRMLLDGLVPYRDFLIVHPPVTSVLLLPSALIGSWFGDPTGLASARVLMVAVGVANVLLVHRLVLGLPKASPRAALVAAALYAVMPDSVVAEHTVLLEPLVNLFCLLAVVALTRQRAVLAGVLLIAGVGCKVFAGAYVVAILLWLVISHRRTLLKPLVAGLGLGSGVLILPFAITDPVTVWHDVMTTQLSRPADNTSGGLVRVLDPRIGHPLALLVLLACVAAVVAVPVSWERRRPQSAYTLWILVTGIGALAFVNSPSYFPHYGAFLVPPLALLACSLEARRAGALALAALTLVFTGFSVHDVTSDYPGQGDLSQVRALVPQGSCVFYEAISLAVAADRLIAPSRTCPSWIDGRGVALTQNTDWPHDKPFYPQGFVADEQWQRDTVSQLGKADYLLLYRSPDETDEWNATTTAYADAHFHRVFASHRGRVDAELWARS